MCSNECSPGTWSISKGGLFCTLHHPSCIRVYDDVQTSATLTVERFDTRCRAMFAPASPAWQARNPISPGGRGPASRRPHPSAAADVRAMLATSTASSVSSLSAPPQPGGIGLVEALRTACSARGVAWPRGVEAWVEARRRASPRGRRPRLSPPPISFHPCVCGVERAGISRSSLSLAATLRPCQQRRAFLRDRGLDVAHARPISIVTVASFTRAGGGGGWPADTQTDDSPLRSIATARRGAACRSRAAASTSGGSVRAAGSGVHPTASGSAPTTCAPAAARTGGAAAGSRTTSRCATRSRRSRSDRPPAHAARSGGSNAARAAPRSSATATSGRRGA